MNSLTKNIVANMVGRSWTMLMAILFVPVYIKLLGLEAYGLIGFFVSLQAVLGVMDLGLSLTLNRELARLSSQKDKDYQMAATLRTLEVIYWLISVCIGGCVVIVSPYISMYWIDNSVLPNEVVENAVSVMGLIVAVQAPFSFYQGGLNGLQRQVTLNGVLIFIATLRGGGAALILWLLSSTVEAYFVWQLVVSFVGVAICLTLVWRFIPISFWQAKIDFGVVKRVLPYTAAVSANAIVGISLTQLDKLILSKLLQLDVFAYYVLGATVAAALWALVLPINAGLFPRFAQLYQTKKMAELSSLYHISSQYMVVAIVPVAATIAFFSEEIIYVWIADKSIADKSGTVVSLLVLGTMLNGLSSVGAIMQSAVGWPGLVLRTNVVLALVLVPTLLVVVPEFEAVGAAAVWVLLNSVYIVVTLPLMHRRLLVGELHTWYLVDIIPPCACAFCVAFLARGFDTSQWSRLGTAGFLLANWSLLTCSCALSAPGVRGFLLDRYNRGTKWSIFNS